MIKNTAIERMSRPWWILCWEIFYPDCSCLRNAFKHEFLHCFLFHFYILLNYSIEYCEQIIFFNYQKFFYSSYGPKSVIPNSVSTHFPIFWLIFFSVGLLFFNAFCLYPLEQNLCHLNTKVRTYLCDSVYFEILWDSFGVISSSVQKYVLLWKNPFIW